MMLILAEVGEWNWRGRFRSDVWHEGRERMRDGPCAARCLRLVLGASNLHKQMDILRRSVQQQFRESFQNVSAPFFFLLVLIINFNPSLVLNLVEIGWHKWLSGIFWF